MLIINSPQRPNGMTVGQLEEIAAICAEHDVIVLTDEIFSHMVYAPAEHKTIAAVEGMADRSILVDTFSKTYIMTGFRIGWCVANKDLITAMDIFQQNSVTNVPAFVQLAALAAITGPQDHVSRPPARLQAKRDKVVAALNAMPGIECPTPGRLVLRLPGHPRHGHDRPAVRRLPHREPLRWASWPAPPSATAARATSGSPTPARTTCSRRASTGSARGWRTSRLPPGGKRPRRLRWLRNACCGRT